MNIAFVLASYAPDVPAGMERATFALAEALRQGDHHVVIITAAPQPAADPNLIQLESLDVRFPCDDARLRAAIGRSAVGEEIAATLDAHRIDVVVYVDALWGLGRAMPDHPARQVLAVHVIGHREDVAAAVATADAVITPSDVVIAQAAARGYRTDGWQVVPNTVLPHTAPVRFEGPARHKLRRTGPIRVLARPSPDKGVDQLLTAAHLAERHVQIRLAAAPFEQSPNAQHDFLQRCQEAEDTYSLIDVYDSGLPWAQVPHWLAKASVVIVPSLAETFGLVALEAMDVGTPVVAYNVGNLPDLIGTGDDAGGVIVNRSSGPEGLWRAAADLLGSPLRYVQTSRAAYYRSRDFRPIRIADVFCKAVS